MYHNNFDFIFRKYSMPINAQWNTYARSTKVNGKLSIEHDYPHFCSDQMHMREKLDFEFNTFSNFCSSIDDALS